MSTTLHVPGVETAQPEHRRLRTLLWVVVGALVAALVALGTWVVVDRYTGSEHDAATLIDDATTAWSAGDVGAATDLYTADYVIVTAWGDRITGARGLTLNVENAAATGLTLERIAPVTTEGDFATTYIRYTNSQGEEGTLLSTFQLEEGKIARTWDFELGVTSPFGARTVIP